MQAMGSVNGQHYSDYKRYPSCSLAYISVFIRRYVYRDYCQNSFPVQRNVTTMTMIGIIIILGITVFLHITFVYRNVKTLGR